MATAAISQREAAAYHEAGHAVVAYAVGWWVSGEGVNIEPRQFCGVSFRSVDNTLWRRVMVDTAGRQAEHRWHGLGDRLRSDDDLAFAVLVARGLKQPEHGDDTASAMTCILQEMPDATDQQLMAQYREYEEDCWADCICDAPTWAAIEQVAKALIEKGRLAAGDVEALLPVTWRTSTPNWHVPVCLIRP